MRAASRIADTSTELKEFLCDTAGVSKYSLEKTRVSDQCDWTFTAGGLVHKSGGFFSVCGVIDTEASDRQHLMLYQPQSALTGLILCRTSDGPLVLLQARVEPGNTGVIQYGPTIQSTPANYLRLHGGKATAYVEQFTEFRAGTNLLTHSMQLDLACRYFQKSKTHHYLEVDTPLLTEENMIWASVPAISGLLSQDNLLNADLRSLLAVFDWTAFNDASAEDAPSLAPKTTLPRCDAMPLGRYRLASLDLLHHWQRDDYGLSSNNEPTGVAMYHFSCTNREVSAWSQPLFTVKEEGLAQLLLRRRGSQSEFLVTSATEPGLSTPWAFYPSYLRSPAAAKQIGRHSTASSKFQRLVQCDEGGRFHQNDTVYELIESEDRVEPLDNQRWISAQTLREILRSSNQASFPLRCAASLALPLLHEIW